MITSVTIQNFKNIRHQHIDLEPLTVFVGANASGKTSVLEAVHLALRGATDNPNSVFEREQHFDWLYSRGGEGELSIHCASDIGDYSVRASPRDGFPPSTDQLGKSRWTIDTVGPELGAHDVVGRSRLQVFLRLNATQLARPSYSDHDIPQVEPNGRGLASVLAFMALNDPDAFDELLAHTRSLIPHLKRIRFRKAPINRIEREFVRIGSESIKRQTSRTYLGEAILFDFDSAENVAAHTVSEGTLLLVGLLTVLLGPTHPRILLMDDLDHGLHPLAQKSLLCVLGKIMERFPNLQILASAHSPYLVDQLRPEQVRLMTIGRDGYAVCGRLEDHPEFQKWKDEMAPGELWSLFGEKWLVERESAT